MTPRESSFSSTLRNNRTERGAIEYLLEAEPKLVVPSLKQRKQLLADASAPAKFVRSFDLVLLDAVADLQHAIDSKTAVTLVDVKATRKAIVDPPRRFFFGATENEFALAALLGDRFQFCFVSLHPETLGFSLLTCDELEPLIRSRRVQYQIAL